MQYVFGLVLYGIPSPFDPTNTAPCLYHNGTLPTTGLPSELSGCTFAPIIAESGLPGVNWGADPRSPVGSDGTITVTLVDDTLGTLGTMFWTDPDATLWAIEANRLATTDPLAVTALGLPLLSALPEIDNVILFVGNEAVKFDISSDTTQSSTGNLTRGLCGSTARVHAIRPTDYSPGEDGTQDRIMLTQRPNWDEGFYCGVYYFELDQFGAINDYVLRRGVVTREPTPRERPLWDIEIRFLEDHLSAHKIGEQSKETTLDEQIIVSKIVAGRPQEISILMHAAKAEAFFNEAVAPRGALPGSVSTSVLADLQTRMKQDTNIWYEIKVHAQDEWVYKINSLSYFSYQAIAGVSPVFKCVKIGCTLQPDGFLSGQTILHTTGSGGNKTFELLPWWQNSATASGQGGTGYASGNQSGTPPICTLRLGMRKSVVKAFLTLAISRDGSSGGAYDLLIGGVGAGLPAAFFNTGAVSGSGGPSVSVAVNTSVLLQLDQLLYPPNTYYFDLSKGISLKDFLANEFLATQLLLGPLQNGALTLKAWVHNVAASITLNPLNQEVKSGQRLSTVKRLGLAAGVRLLSLEPAYTRGLRYLGSSNIKSDETQPVRFWRQGLQLTTDDLTGDLSQLVRVFYRLYGGRPVVYPVVCDMHSYLSDGVEFGDQVLWSDPNVVTPSGLGISGSFFVVGVDLNFEHGEVTYKLLQNLLISAATPLSEGKISPALATSGGANISTTSRTVVLARIDGVTFAPTTDFSGVVQSIKDDAAYVTITNHDHAPVGELEAKGTVHANAKITTLATVAGVTTATITIDSSWLRGDITTIDDLFTTGETRVILPARQVAAGNLEGVLVEPHPTALPSVGNFLAHQPKNPQNAATHTPKAGP